MVELERVAYVRLGTPHLDETVRFATAVLGLQLVEQRDGSAYLRSDDRHHTLCYSEGDPADQAIGFELRHDAGIEAVAAELERVGIPARIGTPAECEQRRVHGFVQCADPTGNAVELVLRPERSGRRYFPARDAGITGFSHIGLCSRDLRGDQRFWTDVLGARVSDWIGDAPLLRINPIHHSIALFPAAKPGVQHVNHQVASLDDVMRSWYHLRSLGVRIRFGPGRHATSGAVFLYFEGPDGMTYEYSCGVREIDDERAYRPRQFPFVPESFCLWGATPDIPEFRSDALDDAVRDGRFVPIG